METTLFDSLSQARKTQDLLVSCQSFNFSLYQFLIRWLEMVISTHKEKNSQRVWHLIALARPALP